MPSTIERFLKYLDASPSPQHAAQQAIELLEAAGYTRLEEGAAPPALAAGGKHYVHRGASLVAFRVGTAPAVEAGFRIAAAHTDSPNLRVKPNPTHTRHGYVRLGIETYGGVLQATWADRDLGLAGQVVLRDGRIALVNIDRPLCRISNLAIHLQRTVNKEGLVLNAQTALPPVLTLDTDAERPFHQLLATEIGCDAADVLTWDIGLYDLTPASLGGLHGEFLQSARLDNLASCHAGLEAFLAVDDAPSTAVLALFDHEEIGSRTVRGAASPLLEATLRRIVGNGAGGLDRALAHSWLVSADMAHAVHPAYGDRHCGEHMPYLNAGPVIKRSATWRYGTEADTSALILRLAESAGVDVQWFVMRSDLACGSTVGPIVATNLGIRTVDIGNPMLSMHSAREVCGTHDHEPMIRILQGFFRGEGEA